MAAAERRVKAGIARREGRGNGLGDPLKAPITVNRLNPSNRWQVRLSLVRA
jgi:hypothetical protein